jgi:hypothetical protein
MKTIAYSLILRLVPRPKEVATIKRSLFSLAVLALGSLAILCGDAQAQLMLTPAGVAAGFQLTSFATGFPNTQNVGPLGIAFPTTGGVLVTDYPGNVRLFPTNSDGQSASSFPPVSGASYGLANAVGLAMVGSNIYMTQQANGAVVQVNANGTLNRTVIPAGNIPMATGIFTNPTNGHLFVSEGGGGGAIFDVNPGTGPGLGTATLFMSGMNSDGLSITTNGSILYAAEFNNRILGFSIANPQAGPVFDSGPISGLDGVALGLGALAGNLFANTNDGRVVEVSLTNPPVQTVIATGGSRGDFITLDPNNTLLATQTDRIFRLTLVGTLPPPGVPEPSSLILLGLGGLGLAGYAWRRRKQSV